MDLEYHQQLQRLQELRRSLLKQQNIQRSTACSTTELESGGSSSRNQLGVKKPSLESSIENEALQDPLIYPGLYAPSGFDMMSILIRVRTRPDPVFHLGNIDSSVALVLCDSAAPDIPIVYCSEAFENLTGYSSAEILGKNCRFLQYPFRSALANQEGNSNGVVHPMVLDVNEVPRAELREKIAKGEEAQVRLVNYTKSGARFENLVTTIPITWDEGEENQGPGKRYIVGFQVDSKSHFG